jgi:tetratricopeptide (TPR) repeat protein
VAKYAGLWLRELGCNAGDVERAVEEAKKEPKLFLAHYIWQVLLRGSGDLARGVAVPLLLHARFGPVPVGVTYITKAVKNGVWRFLKPEELEGASLESLREDALEHITKWLTQQHEDLVEETLRDVAGLNGEEAREPYREALRGLIKTLDWARGEVLKEGAETLAKLGVAEGGRELVMSLLAFVGKRLAAVFKSGEIRSCWRRVAFIAGFALAGFPLFPKREWLLEDCAETLGDALKPCAVDDYLTIDGEIPLLLIYMAQLMPIRELNVLAPFADTKTIDDAGKTAEGLLARWRRGDITPPETVYALGLAALVAGAEVDVDTADLLLYVTPFAVLQVAHMTAVLTVLETLRSLGEKAPHRYVSLLAAASELETLDQETSRYIYGALQQLKDRLSNAERCWALVEAVRAYSNLLRKHLGHIWGRWEEAVADVCELYNKVRGRSTAATPESNLSAQRLFSTVAGAHVLAVALERDELTSLVQVRCGLGDLERETETVRKVLDDAAAHLDELRKIIESDEDFAAWVTVRDVTGNAGKVVEDLRSRFTHVLARYKLSHAIDEKGELDAGKLEEAAKEFEKSAEINRKLKLWRNYLAARDLALRARVLAAKSWEELLERAKGFHELWKEAEKHLEPTAVYLVAAAASLGEYIVYLAASGDRVKAEELLKKRQLLLDHVPEVSVVTRLVLKLFGVGEGAKLEEVIDVFEQELLPEFRPALWLLVGRLQKNEALEICKQLSKPEFCVDAVAAATDDKSETEWEVPEASLLLDKVDGKTLVEVLAPIYSSAQLALMLLATVEGRVDAVRLHGLLGSVAYGEPLARRLFRAVYEKCGDLNSEGCKMALLKLYYYHY